MKTNLSLLGVAGLVLLISHQASQVKADDPSRVTHPIKLSIQTNTAYGPGSHGNRRDSWQVTWTFRNGTDSAWQETVRPNDVVEWHFDSKFFLYVDENASKVDWDQCTDPAGAQLLWKKYKELACPFDKANHRALCAKFDSTSSDWVVRVVFPRQAVNSDIVYRLVTGDCPLAPPQDKQGVLAVPYDYYMVEATLVWDSSGGLRHHHKK